MTKDGRHIGREAQEQIRIQICKRIANGESVKDVLESYNYNRTTYYKFRKDYENKGIKGILKKKGSGKKPLVEKKFHPKIIKMIDGKDPRDYGYESSLWTRKIISELIEKNFNIKLKLTAISDLLNKIGVTPQKPLRRSYERNEQDVENWKVETFPKIQKRAKKTGKEIFFLDEAGIKSDSNLGMTYGVKGKTPIVKTSGQRQKINAISAVNASGKFWFQLYTARFNSELFIYFLRQFLKGRKKSIILVVDGHPSHKSNATKAFIKELKGKLELVFLPPHSPDLNPDEFVWNEIKNNGIAKKPLKKNESLKERVYKDLNMVKNNKKLVRSFFKAKSVAYSSD
jgi:transposase